MDKADAAIAAILSKLDALVSTHAAEGIALTLNAMWWNEVFAVVFAGIALAAVATAGFVCRATYVSAARTEHEALIIPFVLSALGVLFGLVFFGVLFANVQWVTLIDPRMGLALKLIAKVGL